MSLTVAASGRPAPVRLLICGFASPQEDALARLQARGWRHPRIAVGYARLPADPDVALRRLCEALGESGASGVLLLDESGAADRFTVMLRACNRLARAAGAHVARHGRISPLGPGSARMTGPVGDLVRGLRAAGCAVKVGSDPEEGPANHLVYRLLTEAAGEIGSPTVAVLGLPQSGADADRGVDAAVLAFADTLSSATTAVTQGLVTA